jgi:hypothetical protein
MEHQKHDGRRPASPCNPQIASSAAKWRQRSNQRQRCVDLAMASRASSR